MIQDNVLNLIGNTPLIKLRKASEKTGCNIYGKAEFLNPGQSVKDRAALNIIKTAIESGHLHPSGTVVEGTAGNTGIGLAVVCKEYGLKLKIVIPKTQSEEKKKTLLELGAELIQVEAVPYSNEKNYIKYSKKIADDLSKNGAHGVVWANQFDNVANLHGHYQSTGPEIWEQTGHNIDGFICAVGSGGTIAGVGKFLKEQNLTGSIRICLPFVERD